MGKRTKQVREAKRRRARERAEDRGAWRGLLPVASVVVAAAGLIGAFFLVSAGGNGSGDRESLYPVGYTPPMQGDPAAPVEMVMFGDFQCSSCKRFELEVLPALRSGYVADGKVRFVWRNFEHYGEESVAAATAAHCAGELGQFWEYHDLLYLNQRGIGSGAFSRSNLIGFAGQLGLAEGAFTSCLDSGRYDSVLVGDFRMGRDAGINGTPGFLINNQYLAGAQPYDTFASIIEAELAKTE